MYFEGDQNLLSSPSNASNCDVTTNTVVYKKSAERANRCVQTT